MCPASKPAEITVDFGEDLAGRLKSNEVCKSEDYAEEADAKDAKVADAKTQKQRTVTTKKPRSSQR